MRGYVYELRYGPKTSKWDEISEENRYLFGWLMESEELFLCGFWENLNFELMLSKKYIFECTNKMDRLIWTSQ